MKGPEQEFASHAVELYRSGWHVKDIAVEVEASHNKVLDWLQAAGIELRARDFARR